MTEQMAIETITDVVDEKRKYFYETSDIYKTLSESMEVVLQALEEIQQYRAIGTVEGYKRAVETAKENYLLYAEYKAKVKEFESIGTVEELQALKEKSVAKNSEWKYCRKENIATCKNCSYEHYLGAYHQYATNYCPNCGSKMTAS